MKKRPVIRLSFAGHGPLLPDRSKQPLQINEGQQQVHQSIDESD
jgi:hypothetical protein